VFSPSYCLIYPVYTTKLHDERSWSQLRRVDGILIAIQHFAAVISS